MASYYWPRGSSWTASSGGSVYDISVAVSNAAYYYPVIVYREVYVDEPESWTDEDCNAYADLVNNQTKTGWKVQAIIKGDVAIVSPHIEKRTMADFKPLLYASVSLADREKLDAFFSEHAV